MTPEQRAELEGWIDTLKSGGHITLSSEMTVRNILSIVYYQGHNDALADVQRQQADSAAQGTIYKLQLIHARGNK